MPLRAAFEGISPYSLAVSEMRRVGAAGGLPMRTWVRTALSAFATTSLAALAAFASTNPAPTALTHAGRVAPSSDVPAMVAPAVDLVRARAEDAAREAAGGPRRFAIPNEVRITPELDGRWDDLGDGTLMWRLRVTSPGARSLNLGFTRYEMPPGGRLYLYSPDLARSIRPFTEADNADHEQLWTPVLAGDAIVVEVTIPALSRGALKLELGSINVGYTGFGTDPGDGLLSGSCNIDVVCPQGDTWRRQIPAVAVISRGGSLNCTGFMVNNTALDQRPLFMTANHCGYTSSNAPSFVAYWNYETSLCGGIPDGQLTDFSSGATWRASYSPSDFTLLELNARPNPAFGVTYAGWDRSGADAATATAIHHPSVDEKRISFEYQPTTTTSYLGSAVPGDGTHVRVEDWDAGTTEGGSSGSPLFDQNKRVIGQLHGGYASCSSQTSDWYGKFSVSWSGGGSSSSRLRDWLDPVGTGQTTLDTLDPARSCNANGACETGEDCLSCPADCPSGNTGASCGNDVCETAAGEDCLSCPSDCNGNQGGATKNRYCCGDGAGVNPVGCSDGRCAANGNTCSTAAGIDYCCGDTACTGDETGFTCPLDCGTAPACGDLVCDTGAGESPCNCVADCGAPATSESGATCTDGVDNDCDGPKDGADPDCATCSPAGASCTSGATCCSNRCRGGTCR